MVSDRFRTVSDGFGSTVLDNFRTVSDCFGPFRIVSDCFRSVFERFSDDFGALSETDDSTQNFKISSFNWPGLVRDGSDGRNGSDRPQPWPIEM